MLLVVRAVRWSFVCVGDGMALMIDRVSFCTPGVTSAPGLGNDDLSASGSSRSLPVP